MQQKIHMPTTSMIPTHSFGYGTFVDNTTEKNQAIWEMHNSLETVYLLKLNPDNSTPLLSIFPNKHVTTGSNKVQQERKKKTLNSNQQQLCICEVYVVWTFSRTQWELWCKISYLSANPCCCTHYITAKWSDSNPKNWLKPIAVP